MESKWLRSGAMGLLASMVVACGGAGGAGGEPSMNSAKAPSESSIVGSQDSLGQAEPEPEVPAAQQSDTPIGEEVIEGNFVPELGLSATEGFLEITWETFLKTSVTAAKDLPAGEKCSLKPGNSYRFVAVGRLEKRHRWVQLSAAPQGCSFREGFLFEEHFRLLNRAVFVAQPKVETRFKTRMVDSRELSSSEWCALLPGRRYVLQSEPVDAGSGHAKVTFMSGELSGCGFSEGFLFKEHFEDLLPEMAAVETDFPRVMKHILLWEGGCSDHPNDAGGRTYKGITTAVARESGWQKDVCTMPDSLIFSIYREGYWNPRAARYRWPLNLAIMNTEVNSGGGTAQRFLDRMSTQPSILGSGLVNQALWFVDQQVDFYRRIVARAPDNQVFLQGWLNRSDYMKKVIREGQILSLFEAEKPEALDLDPALEGIPSPKAFVQDL